MTPLEGLRAWLAERGASAACITRPVSIAYLTGVRIEPHERLLALAVRPDASVLVVPALEHEHATADARDAEVRSWRDGEDALALLAEALGPADRLAVETDHISFGRAEELRQRLDVSSFLDAGEEIRRRRLVKTPEEIARLERAARLTDEVCEWLLGRLRPGLSELEVAGLALGRIAEAGAQPSFDPLVQSGPNSALPHLGPTGRRLERGDLVLLDLGAAWEGYKGDITRMAVIGEPDARQREIHALVLAARDRGFEAVRPGAAAGEVDAAARAVIEAAGHGERFIHRTGHGLGLDGHEEPNFTAGDQTVLRPGMVATIEPGVYIPGWGGVRIEDDVVVEAAGARSLTALARDLRSIDATT